ncbi:MAG: peptidoglycan bridge formation glycyltransferase FemA/FemB family protein [Bacilli bacterium]
MEFIDNIDKYEYEEFVLSNIYKSHFLQSYLWGEFSYKDKGLIPHYVGIKDGNKIVCATLLLEKKLPLGFSYLYAPRGYVMNMFDEVLLREFTTNIVDYFKSKKVIFIKIDPDIIMSSFDKNDKENIINYNWKDVYNSLLSMGYRHLGFTKNFESSQPRYTFRINMDRPFTDIESDFSKSLKQRIRKAEDYECKVSIGNKDNIKDFYNLMLITENRKGIINHNLKYYEDLYDIFNKENKCNIFLCSINMSKLIDKCNKVIGEIDEKLYNLSKIEKLVDSQKVRKSDLESRRIKTINEIKEYTLYKETYGNEIILNADFVVEYGNKAWGLYAGNHDILTELNSNYLIYKTHIKYYYDKGIKVYDLFGTIGDLSNKSLIGIHEFKKKFGGDYIEFTGEYDYVLNKFMYVVFTKLVPIYRKIIKKIIKVNKKK